MKLKFEHKESSTSRQFEEEDFSLGDVRVIMELLSSKIYSRPEYIIIQEVASNARDANREAGKADVPITIKLPNNVDDNIRIRDNGPGISPDRMSDVFLKYGNSTKRSDNVLTGGFGIGAKTPFTYTDTFTVRTVTDDSDGRHERIYIARKVEGGLAKMSLLTTKKSTDDTGTTISFAVDHNDWDKFVNATESVCRFWNPRPKIEGWATWEWPEDDVIHEGSNWILAESGDPFVLVDNIPYTLRLRSVFDDLYCEEYDVLRQTAVRMFFKTGEVDVSATREDLDYKPRTIQAIKDRATQVLTELRAKVNAEIAKSPNLWEASIAWNTSSRKHKRFLSEPEWKGRKLLGTSLDTPGSFDTSEYPETFKALEAVTKPLSKQSWYWKHIDARDHVKITVFNRDPGGRISSKKTHYNIVVRTIPVADSTLIIEDDIGKSRPNRLRLQTLFDNNPGKTDIAVVVIKQDNDITKAFMKEYWGWDSIPHTKLSTVPKAKNAGNKNAGGYTINAIKMLERKKYGRRRSHEWKGVTDRAPEDDKGGYYVILKDGKPTLKDGTVLSKDCVLELQRKLGIDIHGVLYKYRNKVSDDWTDLLSYVLVQAKIFETQKETQNYIKFGSGFAGNHIGDLVRVITPEVGRLDDQEIVSYLADSSLSLKGRDSYAQMLRLLSLVQKSNKAPKVSDDLDNRWNKLDQRYPLFAHFQRFRLASNNTYVDEIIFYLNSKYKDHNGGN